jgi:hypothetical protein
MIIYDKKIDLRAAVIIELIGVVIKFDSDDGNEQRTVVATATNTITMSKCISSTPAQSEHKWRSEWSP